MLDEYLSYLYIEEKLIKLWEAKGKSTSVTKITRQTKIDRAIGALSTKLAKETNDPLYKKMIRFRDKFFSFRERIKKKYAPKVRTRAVTGQGVGDLVKKLKADKRK
jgi:hypothetical protein